MKILISAVGTRDPISENHDSALLHLARIYRPDKIVLIYSEEMLAKENRIDRALQSIENYSPIIEIHKKILKNNEIYIFDKMYSEISEIIEYYRNDEDELILNLSSATPQIISAMFAVNRINNYNIKAVQVATPNKAANRPFRPREEPDIETLISTNKDNESSPENRCLEDASEKFNQSLLKRYLRQLIKLYDYQNAYEILIKKENRNLLSNPLRKTVLEILDEFATVFKKQTVLSDIKLPEREKKVLNYFLMIDILNSRGQVADVLIKAKSLVEYMLEDYIKEHHENLIIRIDNLPKLNQEHLDTPKIILYLDEEIKKERKIESDEQIYNSEVTLNLLSFYSILEFYNESDDILKNVRTIKGFNAERNRLAHGLTEINSQFIKPKRLRDLLKSLREILQYIYDIDDSYFNYYKDKNKFLLNVLS
ncbi:MAG: type III-A CRISPR-associated CARF protein Csm6 [Streptococcus sp.]|nr:type III-A CRISPR-associated CARF protein Csm6 [Streptococcus sp.]